MCARVRAYVCVCVGVGLCDCAYVNVCTYMSSITRTYLAILTYYLDTPPKACEVLKWVAMMFKDETKKCPDNTTQVDIHVRIIHFFWVCLYTH